MACLSWSVLFSIQYMVGFAPEAVIEPRSESGRSNRFVRKNFAVQIKNCGGWAFPCRFAPERLGRRQFSYVIAVVTAAKNASPRLFLARAGVPFSKAADGRRNVTQPWEYTDVDDHSGLLRMEYDVADGLTVFGSAGAAQQR